MAGVLFRSEVVLAHHLLPSHLSLKELLASSKVYEVLVTYQDSKVFYRSQFTPLLL